jgi:uncharacterized membrane protein YfcA
MTVAGLIVTFGAGAALGLFGGGGSLLMVPALVYCFERPALEATTYSLLVVGIVSALGAMVRHGRSQLPLRKVAPFGVLSIAASYAMRAVVVPVLPAVVPAGPFALERDALLMMLFAVFTGAAGVMMVRQRCCASGPRTSPVLVPIAAIGTGALTGLLGVGGAFLVLPALVLLVGLEVDEAVGASLVLVAAQSLAGVAGGARAIGALDPALAATLTGTRLAGLTLGLWIGRRVAPVQVRRAFGVLTIAVAVATAVQQLI